MPNKARSTNVTLKRTNSSVRTRDSRSRARTTGATTRSRRSSTPAPKFTASKTASRASKPRTSRALEPDPVTKASQQAVQKVGAFFSKSKPTKSTAKREDRRRARNKNRADRMFAASYASEPSSESAEGTPRAALYKGKMGSRQRKSSRMQKVSQAGSWSAKIDPRGWFSNISLKHFPVKTLTAVLCVVLAFAFLYTPAQQYYQSSRERDRLAAEYAAIENRNEALQYQNVALASDAGMEDAVRQKYGYVKPGEQAGKVSGLSDATTDTTRDSAGIEANVLSSTVKAPEEWYTPYLDAFFGVK